MRTTPPQAERGVQRLFTFARSVCDILGLHLTVREDRPVVPLQNGLYQRRAADFVYPLLSRPVPENGVEEEALRGFPRISARVTHDDFSPVFLCLSNAASPMEQKVKMCGKSTRLVTVTSLYRATFLRWEAVLLVGCVVGG